MKFELSINDINYIKILYRDNYDLTRCLKASIKKLSESEISACVKKEKIEEIITPQDVSVKFVCDDGLYKANTTLKSTRYQEPYLFLIIKTPEAVDFQQNREYFRVNLVKDAVITYNENNSIQKIEAKVHDISANGIGLKLEHEVNFPNEVLIDMYFTNRQISAKARFVRTDNEDEIIKSSFSFINLPSNEMDYISRVCIIKQIEDKRKTLK